MVEIALAVLSLVAACSLGWALRRRPARRDSLATRIEPLPAGVKHLASTVSDMSTLGIHLPSATRASRKPRLGALLGLR